MDGLPIHKGPQEVALPRLSASGQFAMYRDETIIQRAQTKTFIARPMTPSDRPRMRQLLVMPRARSAEGKMTTRSQDRPDQSAKSSAVAGSPSLAYMNELADAKKAATMPFIRAMKPRKAQSEGVPGQVSACARQVRVEQDFAQWAIS